jgi:Putative transposase/Transposase zinc-binding domain
MEKQLEVADIFRAHGQSYRESRKHGMQGRHYRAMNAIEICRTAELGGHVDECDVCNEVRISYNSCRNRHCPKCQCLDKERWIEARKRELLPTNYFHVVFTLPNPIRPVALRNQKCIYTIHFRACSETLKELALDSRYLGVRIGFIALLHTWTRTLLDHPHLHCIVPGGGLSLDGSQWISGRKKFFIPVKVLSRLFRGKFLHCLKEAYNAGELVFPGKIEHLRERKAFQNFLSDLYQQEWVVYCKPPFHNAETVMDYLGRYSHRVAISNDRLVKMEAGRVFFRYRDSRDNNRMKVTSLDAHEFIRRFLLHVLPDNFMKIRHYGLLSNRNKKTALLSVRELLGVDTNDESDDQENETWEELFLRLTGVDPRVCPACGKGTMKRKGILPQKNNRSPP